MNRKIRYKQSGVFGDRREAPLEAFYNALLPHLKAYGITVKFPADKPSTETYTSGISFDEWIGNPPRAIRYSREQESFYSNAYDSKSLEADTLSHLETGEQLSLKIEMSNTVPSPYQASGFWLTVALTGEKEQVETMRNAIEPVLIKYHFDSVELEIRPLGGKGQTNGNSPSPESNSDENETERQRESLAADNPPIRLSANQRTQTVVPEQPTRSIGFNLLMGAALLMIGIPAATQFYSRLQYNGFPIKQKLLWGAVSFILIGAATWIFVRAVKIYLDEKRNKPQYEPLDPQTIPKPANRLEIQINRLPDVALAILVCFFGGACWLALFGSSLQITNLVVAFFSLSIIFVNCFLYFRSKRKSVRAFDASGIERGDGQRFSWNEFRGIIIRTANTRYGLKNIWREELALSSGEEAWIISSRVKNYEEVSAFISRLPRARVRN